MIKNDLGDKIKQLLEGEGSRLKTLKISSSQLAGWAGTRADAEPEPPPNETLVELIVEAAEAQMDERGIRYLTKGQAYQLVMSLDVSQWGYVSVSLVILAAELLAMQSSVALRAMELNANRAVEYATAIPVRHESGERYRVGDCIVRCDLTGQWEVIKNGRHMGRYRTGQDACKFARRYSIARLTD